MNAHIELYHHRIWLLVNRRYSVSVTSILLGTLHANDNKHNITVGNKIKS